jgi:hypothetical protein
MTKFIHAAKSNVQVGKRTEEVLTYISEDKSKGCQFHAGRSAFSWNILRRHNMTMQEVESVVEAFVQAAMKQHNFKGGYDEAIQTVSI